MKQLIRSDVQRFGLSSPCLCLMNCGIPLLTLKVKKDASSSQIEINSSVIVQMGLSIIYSWNEGVADDSEK